MTQIPIYMLNVLWFKPSGGREKYLRYTRAIRPLLKKVGARKLKGFVPRRAIVGQLDADLVFFVEFPSWVAYKQFANSAEYHQIAHLKTEALENSLLIQCSRPNDVGIIDLGNEMQGEQDPEQGVDVLSSANA